MLVRQVENEGVGLCTHLCARGEEGEGGDGSF